jgi:ankyrin repeat protein
VGASLTNYQVQSSDRTACVKALKGIIRSRAMITEALHGWITVYDETSEAQDLEELRRVGKALSSKLKAAVFCFMVHDSDSFVYLLFEKGKFLDQFDSRPDCFGPVTDEHRKEWAGHFDKLLPFAQAGTKVERIEKVLHEKLAVEEERGVRFAKLLGIDPERAREGFKYAKEANHGYEIVLSKGYSSSDSELVEAVSKRDLATVRRLLDSGTSPNLKDSVGLPILVKAIQQKNVEIANALLDAGADVLSSGRLAADSLWIAAAEGQDKIIERILDRAKGDDRLPKSLEVAFQTAVAHGRAGAITLLLAAGANVNRQDESGQSALMLAAIRGFHGVWEQKTKKEFPTRPGEVKTDWQGILETLLKAGANLNLQTGDGATALMAAASRGYVETCRLLVEAGADVNLKHSKGFTALALAGAGGHKAIVDLLLAHGGSEPSSSKT